MRLGHLEVASPFGPAGGVVKSVHEVEKMAKTGVGWIEAGSYTLEPRAGNGANGEVVYRHDQETGETYNSLGMPNKGMDIVEREIPEMRKIARARGMPLIINVAPVTDEPDLESMELVSRSYDAGADAVMLNAGCPNVLTQDGGKHERLSYSPAAFLRTLIALKPVVERYKPIMIRVSPQESSETAMKIVELIQKSKTTTALSTPNTWEAKPLKCDGEPLLEVPGGTGGKSGPATADQALEQSRWLASSLAFDLMSTSGIMNGKELARRRQISRRIGIVGAGTTFFYESGDWKEDVDRLLRQFVDAQP